MTFRSLALLLTFLLCVEAQASQQPSAADVHLVADRLVHELAAERWTATGNVVLRTPELHVRAAELVWEAKAERAYARGGVLLVQGGFVAVAEELEVSLSDDVVTLTGGLIVSKRGVSRKRLEAAVGREELLGLGENEIALRGERIRRVAPDHFQVEGLSFTPCDCDVTTPSWAIRAALADVWPGRHAILKGWRVEVGGAQVTPPLPWLDLPLANRRTGFLIPRPSFSQVGGWGFSLPFFLELGRSYDLTLTPGATFGPNPTPYGMLGPSLGTEFRYAPAEGVLGSARFNAYVDLREDRTPLSAAPLAGTQRGFRWDAALEHRQELGTVGRLVTDLRLVSDGYLPRDVTSDVLLREAQYLRSTAVIAARGRDAFAGLDAVLRQDLRTGHDFALFTEDLARTVPEGRAPATLQRLPGLVVSLPERALWGSLFGSFRLDATRLAPWVGPGGDEGLDGLTSVRTFLPGVRSGPDLYLPLRNPDAGEGNGLLDPGERERRMRLELLPRLSVPANLGPVALAASAAWRQSLVHGEITGTTEHRGLPLLGASAETSLARPFALGGGRLIHAVAPRVEALWVPFTLGSVAGGGEGLTEGGELWDRPLSLGLPSLLQPERTLQTIVALRQRLLWQGSPKGPATQVLMLELGQGLEWLETAGEGPDPADTFGRLETRIGAFRASGLARFDPRAVRVSQAALEVGFEPRPFGVWGSYMRVGHEGSDRLRRGVDALFGLGTSGPLLQSAEQVQLGARSRTPIPGLTARANALFQPGFAISSGALAGRIRPFAQGTAGVAYAPACDCWTLELDAGAVRNGQGGYGPVFQANLTLANFGRLGAP